MTVRVSYFGQLASLASVASETYSLPADASLVDVLASLRERHREKLAPVLFEGEALRKSVLVFQSGSQVRPANTVPIKDGDELLLMLPIAGG